MSLADAVAAYEKDLIQDALKTARGNRSKAARLLRSTERIISYKVRKFASTAIGSAASPPRHVFVTVRNAEDSDSIW